MKHFFLVTAMLLGSFTAAASGEIRLTDSDKRLYILTSGEVLDAGLTPPNCPNALCGPGGVVKVRLALASCVDRLGFVTAQVQRIQGDHDVTYVLDMTAIGIGHKKSNVVRCDGIPTQDIEVRFPVLGYSAPRADQFELNLATGDNVSSKK